MSLAVLVFSLVVGFFHFQGDAGQPSNAEMLADSPDVPAGYSQAPGGSDKSDTAVAAASADRLATGSVAVAAEEPLSGVAFDEAGTEDAHQLAQQVADLIAADPKNAAAVLTKALARADEQTTLGDIATLTAAATRAAPEQASAIAGAATRSLRGRGNPALAASIATIVSLVPEQTRDVGLVVGAILGDDVDALGMVAQTVAIATGEATFSSLSEGSGVSVAALMKASAGFGVNVPFDVPAYAAQLAPGPSRVAEGVSRPADQNGDL